VGNRRKTPDILLADDYLMLLFSTVYLLDNKCLSLLHNFFFLLLNFFKKMLTNNLN
jgi:hypothetical protein